MNIRYLTILLTLFPFTSIFGQLESQSDDQSIGAYEIIYEADKDGNRISGSLEDLVTSVQNGNPIRVGWVLKLKPQKEEAFDMQHWTDAGFITTLRGHVFAQINGIFQQGPEIKFPPGVSLGTDIPNSWVAIIGTTGVMNQKFLKTKDMVDALKKFYTDEEINEYFKKQETTKVPTKWAVLKSN